MRGSKHHWFVILRADGVVESVEGGAPVTWLGHVLAELPDAPADVRKAAEELGSSPPTSNVRRRYVTWVVNRRTIGIEVLLIEALPVRRAHTRVHELVMRTLDVFALQAKSSKIDLTIEKAPDVPAVVVLDGEKIAWALSTLVGNALRYAQSHVGVHLHWDETTSVLVFDVSDDGPGMLDHQKRWLFERNPMTGQSAGLALVMVRDVLAAHRGSVTVASRIGNGTTFTMRLPRVRAG